MQLSTHISTVPRIPFSLAYTVKMSEPRSLSLPAAAVRELPDLEDVLQSAAYKPFFDYEICVDQDVINKMTPFARHLPPPVDVSTPEHFIPGSH